MNRLEQIEAREKAATPGQWYWDRDQFGQIVIRGLHHQCDDGVKCKQCERNADYSAHARQDIPALLAVVRGLVPLVDEVGCPFCDEDFIHHAGCPLSALLEEVPE